VRINLVGPFYRNAPFGTECAFASGLIQEGHSVVCHEPGNFLSEPLDPAADATVFFKWVPEQTHSFKEGGLRVIYQPDNLEFEHIRQLMSTARDHGVTHALTFYDTGCALARDMGFVAAEKLMLTADPDVYFHDADHKMYAASFVGGLGHGPEHVSRQRMVRAARLILGDKFLCTTTFDIPTIRHIYSHSRVVLHHATDVGQPFGHGLGLQCRHFEAALCGIPVLSNVVWQERPDVLQGLDTFSSMEELGEKLFAYGAAMQTHTIVPSSCDIRRAAIRDHGPRVRASRMVEIIQGWK
jgi:hypothetical protein